MRYIILNLVIVFCTMSCQSSKPEQTKLMQGEMWRVAEINSIPLTVPTTMHLSEGMVRDRRLATAFSRHLVKSKQGLRLVLSHQPARGAFQKWHRKKNFFCSKIYQK